VSRQIVLDTETTGLDAEQGHRIIEIGCVELINRKPTGNNYHRYLNPDREIDEAAIEVHGITLDDLKDKPRFADVAEELTGYLKGAELVIHNAAFDVGFLDAEFKRAKMQEAVIDRTCTVLDTIALARKLHPGQKANLDALCRRYYIDNSARTFHGALLDAEILADVYLAMTGGQTSLLGDGEQGESKGASGGITLPKGRRERPALAVIEPSAEEAKAHEAWLGFVEQETDEPALWKQLDWA